MMNLVELRDLDEARMFLAQGLWLQRMVKPGVEKVAPALHWALVAAGTNHCLPVIGFIADLGHNLLEIGSSLKLEQSHVELPGFPTGLLRAYEDNVLGKIFADFSMERAGDSLRRYQGKDKARGLAFVLQQLRQRLGFQVVSLSPAVIKGLLREPAAMVLKEGWEGMLREGVMPALMEGYESLVAAARQSADLLGNEDIFELEHGTALAEFGQRIALRQVLQASDMLEKSLPPHRPKPAAARKEVPTRILDEDTYPVGGFASLSTRGSIESLLHSQLAFMEKDDRPDLFDIKYLRDELLYYSRDENQFLRRRRTFVFLLAPDLVEARFKDANLPWQRIILLLALLVVTVRKLCEWLSEDALEFHLLFLEPDKKAEPLADEKKLLQTVLREQIANGTVIIENSRATQIVSQWCAFWGRRSNCQALTVALNPPPWTAQDTLVSQMKLAGPQPKLISAEVKEIVETEDALHSWTTALERLLASLVK